MLLDAASYVSSHALDLREVPADYTVLSFYKMFGYPTGVGALVVRLERWVTSPCYACINCVISSSSAAALQPVYFGGGSVDAYSGHADILIPSLNVSKRLEHGTLPFTALLAVQVGTSHLSDLHGLTYLGTQTAFDLYQELGLAVLRNHTYSIARAAYVQLYQLRHANGRSVVLFHMPCGGASPELPAVCKPGGMCPWIHPSQWCGYRLKALFSPSSCNVQTEATFHLVKSRHWPA